MLALLPPAPRTAVARGSRLTRPVAACAAILLLSLASSLTAMAQGGQPDVAALTLNPTQVTGGTTVTATVVLDQAAPNNGFDVTLGITPGNGQLSATLLHIAPGQSSGVVTVITLPTTGVHVATLTASARNKTVTATLTVNPPAVTQLSLSPTSVQVGSSVTGRVSLDGAAPTGGSIVSLSGSGAAGASWPASVTVGAGQTSANFTITSSSTSSGGSVTITATTGAASRSATFSLVPPPPRVAGLTLSPTSVSLTGQSTARVTLDAPAPAGGASIALSQSSSNVTIPTSVSVAAGQTSVDFVVTAIDPPGAATGIGSATVTATSGGQSRSATLTITGVPLELTLLDRWKSGKRTSIIIYSQTVPNGGGSVTLSVSGIRVSQNFFPPVSLTQNGSSGIIYTEELPRVDDDAPFVLIASAFGHTTTKSGTLTSPRLLRQVNIDSVYATTIVPKVVLLDASPLSSVSTTFASSSPLITSASRVSSRDTVTYSLTVGRVNTKTPVVVSVSRLDTTLSDTIWVLPGRSYMTNFALSSGTMAPGQTVVVGVQLNGPAPAAGTVVTLSATSPLAAAINLPAQFVVPAGSTQATVSFTTKPGASPTTGTITATVGTQQLTAKLTVQ